MDLTRKDDEQLFGDVMFGDTVEMAEGGGECEPLARDACDTAEREASGLFGMLPDEAAGKVFGQLDPVSAARLMRTCRRMRRIGSDKVMFKEMYDGFENELPKHERGQGGLTIESMKGRIAQVLAERRRQTLETLRRLRVRRSLKIAWGCGMNSATDLVVALGMLVGVIFLALKLERKIDWNWFFVLLPCSMMVCDMVWSVLMVNSVMCWSGGNDRDLVNETDGICKPIFPSLYTWRFDANHRINYRVISYTLAIGGFLAYLFLLLKLSLPSFMPWRFALIPMYIESIFVAATFIVWRNINNSSIKWDRIMMGLAMLLVTVMLIFIGLQLDEIINWQWRVVFIPMYVVAFMFSIGFGITGFINCMFIIRDEYTFMEYFGWDPMIICLLGLLVFLHGPIIAFFAVLSEHLDGIRDARFQNILTPVYIFVSYLIIGEGFLAFLIHE